MKTDVRSGRRDASGGPEGGQWSGFGAASGKIALMMSASSIAADFLHALYREPFPPLTRQPTPKSSAGRTDGLRLKTPRSS
jgi:hypothetical protein